jgi:hypothetical protein
MKSLPGLYKQGKIISGKTDLRNDSLTVKHQGQRNTRSVFAATALIEYSIFGKYDTMDNETGNFRLPTENDIDCGGHVILLVGYDSGKRTFIFQNSWGTNWGQGGFGTIPEDYIINYFEAMEVFPYGNDAIAGEKTEAVKASMGVSVSLNFN